MAKPISKNPDTTHIYQAVGFFARFYGWHCFKQHKHLLFFPACSAVHGMGLKTSLWVLFVNQQGQPLGEWRYLKPNGLLWHYGAYGVLERVSMPKAKRRILDATLKTDASWLTKVIHWEVDYLGRRYCGK